MANWEWLFPIRRYIRLREEPSWSRAMIAGALGWLTLLVAMVLSVALYGGLAVTCASRSKATRTEWLQATWRSLPGAVTGLARFVPSISTLVTIGVGIGVCYALGYYLRGRFRMRLNNKFGLLIFQAAGCSSLAAQAICFGFVAIAGPSSVGFATIILVNVLLPRLVVLAAVLPSCFHAQRAMKLITRADLCRCGYSRVGLTTPRCPECGEAFDPDLLEELSPEDAAAVEKGAALPSDGE